MKIFKATFLGNEGLRLVDEESGDAFLVKGGPVMDIFLNVDFPDDKNYKMLSLGPATVDSIQIFKLDKMIDTDFERIADKIKGLSQDDIKKIWLTLDKQHEASFALGIWARFKALHPNTPESPDYSEASIKRWLYHINEAEKNKGFENVELDLSEIEAIRHKRHAKNWIDFNIEQQIMYEAIANCFPGTQVFACGSQVRGDYIRHTFPESRLVRARKLAGMRVDRISDYDFWVHPSIQQTKELPINADRYRGKFNENEMVAIPIYYGDV